MRRTSPFILETVDFFGEQHLSWDVARMGRPTQRRLVLYVQNFIASLGPTGHNSHLAQMYGAPPIPSSARIVNQSTGEVIAQWKRG